MRGSLDRTRRAQGNIELRGFFANPDHCHRQELTFFFPPSIPPTLTTSRGIAVEGLMTSVALGLQSPQILPLALTKTSDAPGSAPSHRCPANCTAWWRPGLSSSGYSLGSFNPHPLLNCRSRQTLQRNGIALSTNRSPISFASGRNNYLAPHWMDRHMLHRGNCSFNGLFHLKSMRGWIPA